MIFAQMLEIVALSDLASVLCARKFSFDPQVGFTRHRETSALRACLNLMLTPLNLPLIGPVPES